MTRKVFLVLLALVLALSVGFVACGGAGQEEEEEETYDLTIASTGGGSVVTPGEGSFTYDEVTVVNLVAQADEGYRFVNWTGDVSTIGNVNAATTIITTNGHYSIIANFTSGIAIPPKNPESFVQMTTGDVDSLDPAWAYDTISCEQVQYIYEPLLFYDGEEIDEFVPILATEWEWDDADVAWRFRIREGVKFHEGGDLTPSDVEYSFERAMVQDRYDEGLGPIWMLYQPVLGLDSSRDGGVGEIVIDFDQIDNAVEVDGDSVVFYLVDSTWQQRFLLILCGTWASIVDKEWCVANGEWDGTEQTWLDYNKPDKAGDYLYNHTNGTGPWKLEEWDMGVQIELVRNDAYWREPAPFETVTTQFVEDWTTRREALLAGDADHVYTTRSWSYGELEGVEALEGIADLNIYKDLPGFIASALSFNMDIATDSSFIGSGALNGDGIPTDFFSDIDVRKGFCYAFDYETYIEDGWAGQAQRLGSPVIEGLAFYNPDASAYSLDLDKAEEHLKAAWSGEVWEKGFKFTLVYDADLIPPQETASRILAENLLAINPKFQISIESMDFWTAMLPNMTSRFLPTLQTFWAGDWPHPDNYVVPYMASDGAWARWQSYGNSELDELIENALREPNPTVQQYLYYAIQERYYEDAPSTALVQPLGRRYFTKYIHGFYYHPMIPGRAGPLYYMSKSES